MGTDQTDDSLLNHCDMGTHTQELSDPFGYLCYWTQLLTQDYKEYWLTLYNVLLNFSHEIYQMRALLKKANLSTHAFEITYHF